MAKSNSKAPRTPKAAEFKAEPKQGDLFVCEIANWPVKDDLASMEVPIFSLAKQRDFDIREYKRGDRYVRIAPSAHGAATVFDKDLLLYIASQIVEARNQGKQVSRTVKIDSIDFLLGTERGDGRASFERILDMLRRLKGTTIETNIPTNGLIQTQGFGLIDAYEVLSEKMRTETKVDNKTGENKTTARYRLLSFTVTISEWLYNGLLNYEVLTLDRGYFRLSRSIERRLYEIARKHCGDQPMWKINIDLLAEKIGIAGKRFKVREELRQAIEADQLPEYRIALDTGKNPDDVVFYTREGAKFAKELHRTGDYHWFQSLERPDNVEKWRRSKAEQAA